MTDSLKLISSKAKRDMLISFITDLLPLIERHRDWLAEHHREGETFAGGAMAKLGSLLEAGEQAVREQGEATMATQEQAEVMARARELTREVQRRGRYISTELRRDPTPAAQGLARKVELACGFGLRIKTARQTGLRRLLTIQQQGLTEIEGILREFKQTTDLPSQLTLVQQQLEESIRNQSKEALEAAIAQDEVERRCEAAVDWSNRILRLVNLEWDQAPPELRTSLLALQSDHPGVFWYNAGSRSSAAPEEPLELTSPNADPAVPVAAEDEQ